MPIFTLPHGAAPAMTEPYHPLALLRPLLLPQAAFASHSSRTTTPFPICTAPIPHGSAKPQPHPYHTPSAHVPKPQTRSSRPHPCCAREPPAEAHRDRDPPHQLESSVRSDGGSLGSVLGGASSVFLWEFTLHWESEKENSEKEEELGSFGPWEEEESESIPA